MNENERIEQQQHPLHHEPFENFDYYNDYSETPDSITSTSQYTNNDCMMNNGDTDNNNNVNGATNNGQKSNCIESSNQQATNETEWQQQTTSTSASTTSSTPQITTATTSPSATTTTTTTVAITAGAVLSPSPTSTAASPSTATDTIQIEAQTNAVDSNTEPNYPIDGNLIKKNDPPSVNTTIKSPAKHNTNKKVVKSKKVRKSCASVRARARSLANYQLHTISYLYYIYLFFIIGLNRQTISERRDIRWKSDGNERKRNQTRISVKSES